MKNVRTQPVLNSIFLMVKTDQGHLWPRRVRLNPGIQPIPWPDTKKWSKSWSCSQDDFAHRWFQKFLNMSIHVRIYFNLKLHFRNFRKNLENAVSAIFIKIWESVILSNFEKQFLSVQIQHWIIIITKNSRPIKFLISVCPTNTLDGLIIHGKH